MHTKKHNMILQYRINPYSGKICKKKQTSSSNKNSGQCLLLYLVPFDLEWSLHFSSSTCSRRRGNNRCRPHASCWPGLIRNTFGPSYSSARPAGCQIRPKSRSSQKQPNVRRSSSSATNVHMNARISFLLPFHVRSFINHELLPLHFRNNF
jgi:hypothetical protein